MLFSQTGIILPAYNAEVFLEKTLQAVLDIFPPHKIIVVDDGSSDQTFIKAQASGVICVKHAQNLGKGSALMSGFSKAKSLGWEWTITLDADGQHSPGDLESFLTVTPQRQDALYVGKRKILGTTMPFHRRLSNSLTTWIISKLAGQNVYDAQCGYRMYRLSAVNESAFPLEGRFEFEAKVLVLLSRQGFLIKPVDIATVYTDNGSHMRLVHDTLRFIRMVWRLAWTH